MLSVIIVEKFQSTPTVHLINAYTSGIVVLSHLQNKQTCKTHFNYAKYVSIEKYFKLIVTRGINVNGTEIAHQIQF